VAAASLLHLARAAAARGRAAAAVRSLERLILDYPESALAPEARRELDRVRGLVPRS
jgi:TolA-binding protein